ncbi:hypothetical protein FcAc13_01375 [Frischella sp. Ac13]|uniref:Bacterial toxin 50 domain-containing protein n=1 Tax=Frischella japonica TaxID=2741544 RepID=A0ABR7QUS8_9GAMM|nr:hypothetical protein [Frischella japonica]
MSQFLVGFIPMFKASKFIRPLQKMGSWGKGMIAGSVTDFVVFNPHEERLSNLIQQFPELANPVTEYLQAKPDDNAAEGRLKNSLEGLLIGSLAEPLTRSLRLLKYARIKITATEVRTKVHYKIDTVTVELDEVNWNNVVETGMETSNSPVKPRANFAPDANPNLNVNMNQQNKHIVGTNEHKTANASSSTPRSTLNNDIDIQSLVNQYAGTGTSLNSTPLGKPGSRERITGNKVIGNYYNMETSKFEPTANFTIHYSKTGVHIVPARPTK